MVELKSCGSLVNASAFCAIDQEVKGENTPQVNAIAEISAELQREREKNAQLVERISALEAQILNNKHNQSFFTFAQGSCLNATERRIKKFKRQKLGSDSQGIEETNVVVNGEIAKDHANVTARKLVNWMSMDETQFLHTDKLIKDEDLVADCDDTDDSDEEYECEELVDHHKNGVDSNTETSPLPAIEQAQNKRDIPKIGSISLNRKPPKMAFCPKEVKRILESEILSSKNAQIHTIRKIIVFASLGIRHGCDDMYELDFNHFSIQRRGQPYVSANDPGEHVLYEIPGVRKKMFFPNQQNPILCPVRILEEEKAMRPGDPSCPSCLFLCIKYGGRTRNLPQNEYVRQRMGRNKLKSFGPEMCRMAMLVHIRSGSFFFKALGITLLFMAGFPDDLVQRETKYRNLDLLQKYYRTDEDAEGEELFHPHPSICDTQSIPGYQNLTGKAISTKSRGKKQSKSEKSTKSSTNPTVASTSASPTQFGIKGYASIHQNQTLCDNSSTNFSYNNQYPYNIFSPQPPNAFMPMVYWSAPNPYASAYGYHQAFPSNPNYISVLPQPYYSHLALVPKMLEKNWKNDHTAAIGSDSDSSSSSKEPNKVLASSS